MVDEQKEMTAKDGSSTDCSPQDHLRARLRSFMKPPKKGETLTNYLGAGYPLFGNRGKSAWAGIKDMGFPFLVTKDRMLTEIYVRAVCPEGRETAALEALQSGDWVVPKDLHIRVWTPQPKKKGEAPQHAIQEIVQAFQAAGITALEFMNTVKTAENSVRLPGMPDVSQAFFEEWESAMRSGQPYLCFLPEKKNARIPESLHWFESVLGVSANGANRTNTEDDILAQMGGGGHASGKESKDRPEAVWLWKLRESVDAHLSLQRDGIITMNDSSGLNLSPLQYGLKDAVKTEKQENKERGARIEVAGENLMKMMEDGEWNTVAQVLEAMQDADEFAEWFSESETIRNRVRNNGMNITL